jgi:hypothetical protein
MYWQKRQYKPVIFWILIAIVSIIAGFLGAKWADYGRTEKINNIMVADKEVVPIVEFSQFIQRMSLNWLAVLGIDLLLENRRTKTVHHTGQ